MNTSKEEVKLDPTVKLYSKYKYIFGEKMALVEGDGLFAHGTEPTNIQPEDLPAHFVNTGWNTVRYIDALGVVDLKYEPNMWINHLLKDDYLYVSYGQKITIEEREDSFKHVSKDYKNYDVAISGYGIIDFLKAVEATGFNIDELKDQLEKKRLHFKEKHPFEYEMGSKKPFFQ